MNIIQRKYVLFVALSVSISLLIIYNFSTQKLIKNKKNHNFPAGTREIHVSARGYWVGQNLAEYHAWHYGPNLSGRLLSFFKSEDATSVVDLGGGAGLHAQLLMRNGIFASCYDGSPDAQDISQGLCAAMDLTKPMQLSRYDWVLCLSVGRQIPIVLENIFMQNIDSLNSRGVVIFWGDGKPGKGPKNQKSNTQVIALFEELGYTVDESAGTKLRGEHPSSLNYSIQVFRRNRTTFTEIVTLNHPGNYQILSA